MMPDIEIFIKRRNGSNDKISTADLHFREDQDFNNKYIVCYRDYPLNAYLLKRESSHKFKVQGIFNNTSYFGIPFRTIQKFVNGQSDFYCVDDIIYDQKHNPV
jgi:hypothetical protein